MRKNIVGLILLSLLLPVSDAETMEGVKPGSVSINLAGGYTLSFVLPDTESAYNLEFEGPDRYEIGNSYGDYYLISVEGVDSGEYLAEMDIIKFPEKQINPKLEPNTVRIPMIGVYQQMIPVTIDGSLGYILYDWNINNTSLDPREATVASLYFHPGAIDTSDGQSVERLIDFYLNNKIYEPSGYGDHFDIFKSIIDSVHLSGPGIRSSPHPNWLFYSDHP